MPCAQPIYFEGDILSDKLPINNSKPFGIFEVDIESPINIKIPLLQTKVKLKNGTTRTISPLGTWTGHYFSDELYNASKHGYKFKVKRGGKYMSSSSLILNHTLLEKKSRIFLLKSIFYHKFYY